jgi:hypothetical protein
LSSALRRDKLRERRNSVAISRQRLNMAQPLLNMTASPFSDDMVITKFTGFDGERSKIDLQHLVLPSTLFLFFFKSIILKKEDEE